MAKYLGGSRYKNGILFEFDDIQIIFPEEIYYNNLNSLGSVTVTAGSQYRPDLVSNDAYRRYDLGWHIMTYNLIDSPDLLVAGLTLQIPEVNGVIF